jgi:ferritin-like metal-binding protein YciE
MWKRQRIGGLKDIRVRYKEFEDDERSSKNVLLKAISGVIEDAKKVLQSIDENSLLDARRIQGFDETVITAIYGTVSHFELHVGQILYASRFFLGDRYVLSWKPETREQGLK